MSRQLPTAILFKDGKELRRFPPLNEKGVAPRVLKFDKAEIAKYFDFGSLN
jgi:hypothetical protein